MTRRPSKLMWLDIETTGLDPAKDDILEIGCRVTGPDAQDCIYRYSTPTHPSDGTLRIDNPTILDMHCRNGLLTACLNSGTGLTEALAELHADLTDLSDVYTLHPAGSTPQFDLEFIRAKAAGSKMGDYWADGIVSYRRLDLTSLRMTWQILGVDPYMGERTDHRVDTCLDRDIAEYRHRLAELAPILAAPTPAVAGKETTDGE